MKKTGAAADMLKNVKGNLASKIAGATGHERSGFADVGDIGFVKAGPDGRLYEETDAAPQQPSESAKHSRRPSRERPPSPPVSAPFFESQGFAAFTSEPAVRSASPQPAAAPAGQSGRSNWTANGDLGGVPSRPRTPSESGELERVREELRKVLDEKAYLAERCSKMEFIIRALQDQIKEMQVTPHVLVPGEGAHGRFCLSLLGVKSFEIELFEKYRTPVVGIVKSLTFARIV
jgi:hypothetical protein